jgi:hypothetical protein
MFEGWFDRFTMCITLPMSAPACRPFWETTMYACAVIGAALIAWLVWKWFDQPVKQAAVAPSTAKPAPPADKPVARQRDPTDHEDIASDVTDPHLAKKIRAELEQRRLKNLRG